MRFTATLALTALVGVAGVLPAAAKTLLVPQQYPTIGAAVAAAKPNDTVQVSPKPHGGVYNEAVTITTPHLTLQGVGNPVLDGTGLATLQPQFSYPPYYFYIYANGVDVRASNVTVSGLVVQNFGGAGINVGYNDTDTGEQYSFNHIQISGNVVQDDGTGISISGAVGLFFSQTILSGYQVVNNVATGNNVNLFTGDLAGVGNVNPTSAGISILANGVQVTGNRADQNYSDGIDVNGDGLNVSGNETGNNTGSGMSTVSSDYNPNVPGGPAASSISFNNIHDNSLFGIVMSGTETLAGNIINHNAGYGVYIAGDYSNITGNQITNTIASPDIYLDSGAGILIQGSGGFGGDFNITLNNISGNASDGLYQTDYGFGSGGTLIAGNLVDNNQGIGIHVSNSVLLSELNGGNLTPDTITFNEALGNTLYDAQDDTSAPAPDGDGLPTPNIWTKNYFGRTNPPNLSH